MGQAHSFCVATPTQVKRVLRLRFPPLSGVGAESESCLARKRGLHRHSISTTRHSNYSKKPRGDRIELYSLLHQKKCH
eukprot:6477546-Amphidinium_carterae.2